MVSYYDLISGDFEGSPEIASQNPPLINLVAAASYVFELLQSNDLEYAFMGGFAMVCRGSSRRTQDVNVATTASMKQLWKVVEPEPGMVLPRLIVPNTKLLDKVIRIYVRTGPTFGDSNCTVDRLVEVDLNSFGTRADSSDLSHHIETIEVDFEGQTFYVNVLDVYYMVRTKLRTLTARMAGEDFEDMDFLLTHYGHQVVQIADRINLEDRASFIDTDLVQSRGPFALKQYREILCI